MATRYRWDDFVLDLDTYRLERAGTPLSLEPKAFNLLVLLVSRPAHLFTKQEIFDRVWPDTAVTDHALTRVVAQLRRVLGDDVKEVRYLETVPTRGYRWVCPVETEAIVEELGEPSVAESSAVRQTPRRAETGKTDDATHRPLWRHPAILTAAVLVVVTGALVWSELRGGVPVQSSTTEQRERLATLRGQFPVQLTTHPGLDLNPAFSPQGDAIAFASDRTGAFEIHVRSMGAGATEVAVTTDGGQNVQPAWSPDGRLLAYHSAVHGGVWIVPARGGTPRQVVTHGSNPEWSPDGRRLVYQSDEHPDITPTGFGAHVGSTLWLVDVEGGQPEQLTVRGAPEGGHGMPSWSRNGRFIAFSVFDGGAANGVWVVRVGTREVTPIDKEVRGYETVFAEHDTALYVAAGEPVIFRLPFDPETGAGTGAREPILVPGVAGARGLSVSGDGRQIAFAGLELTSHIWAQPVDPEGRPAGVAYALTSDTSRRNYVPAISPDGTKVAYMSARRGEAPNIWMMDLATRQALQLTDDEGFDSAPSWSPDGRRIAYSRDRPGDTGYRTIDIATRRQESIIRTDRPPEAVVGSDALVGRLAEIQLSPSMKRVAFAMAAPPLGFRRVYVGDVSPFSARALTDGAVSVGYPAWSRDERSLGVEVQLDGATELAIIDLATSRVRQLTHLGGQVWVRSFSPDGLRMAAAVLDKRRWSLEWFDVHTGERQVIVPPGPANVYYRYPEASPAGDLVVFERGEMTGNIWRLTLPEAR